MNSVEEIKLLKRQFNALLEECDNRSSLLKLYDRINRPYFAVVNSKNQVSEDIDKYCNDDYIKQLNQNLDYKFHKIQKIKHSLNSGEPQYTISDLDQTTYEYYNLKNIHDNVTYQRCELQCKYVYLKNTLPKVEKVLIKLKSKIGNKMNHLS